MLKILSPQIKKHFGDDLLNINEDDLTKLKAEVASRVTKMKHAPELMEIYLSEMSAVASQYVHQLKCAQIDIFTPLTMNMEESVPLTPELYWRYSQQLEIISTLALKYPWRMFPFVFFDPRSENSFEMCKNALENLGFLGVKMYPALGYHPDPSVVETAGVSGLGESEIGIVKFPNGTPNHAAARRLRSFYKYCADNSIPITTHTSVGGAYSARLYNLEERIRWQLTDPENWRAVLQQYKLKINFAHMGGNYINPDRGNTKAWSCKWRSTILEYLKKSDLLATVYADVSYHDMAHSSNDKEVAEYFEDLREVLNCTEIKGGVMYGSDASMITHTWFEDEFIKPFIDTNNLLPDLQEKLFTTTPLSFLFQKDGDGYVIPHRYIKFLEENGALQNLPTYVQKIGTPGIVKYVINAY